jgi:cellulose synthase/poly-beta-1,6-N-acetylglucosamine synthase-like glycosyltransferase
LIFINLLIFLFVRQRKALIDINETDSINFTILIPFKNESKNLARLVNSINKINYSEKLYEVIFINDNSSDDFLDNIVNNISSKVSFRIISPTYKSLPAKKGALDFGLKNSKNNYVITTDADTQLPENFLKIYSKMFVQNYDIVFGPSHLLVNNTFAGKLSQFYNLRNQMLIFTASECGIPYSAMGSNLAYKKDSFLRLGGYEHFSEVISGDDDLLIREGIKNNFKIGSILSKDFLVKSNSVTTFRDFLNQKARHTATSNYYLLKHKILLGILHSINIIALFSPILMAVDNIFIIPFLTKIICDIVNIKSKEELFEYKFTLIEIIKFQIMYEILLIVNYINGSLKRYSWK